MMLALFAVSGFDTNGEYFKNPLLFDI